MLTFRSAGIRACRIYGERNSRQHVLAIAVFREKGQSEHYIGYGLSYHPRYAFVAPINFVKLTPGPRHNQPGDYRCLWVSRPQERWLHLRPGLLVHSRFNCHKLCDQRHPPSRLCSDQGFCYLRLRSLSQAALSRHYHYYTICLDRYWCRMLLSPP